MALCAERLAGVEDPPKNVLFSLVGAVAPPICPCVSCLLEVLKLRLRPVSVSTVLMSLSLEGSRRLRL